MTTHYIYHIPKRKVGCTKDIESRKKWYKREGTVPRMIILEILTNTTDQEAGDIEWQYADKFGYKRGPHYATTIKLMSEEDRHQLAIKMGRRTAELGLTAFQTMSFKQRQEAGRKGGRRVAELGVGGYQNLTPERRREISQKGGRRAIELGLTPFPLPHEQCQENGRKGGLLGGCSRLIVCPYCGKEGQLAAMSRWHFDNCPKLYFRRPKNAGS